MAPQKTIQLEGIKVSTDCKSLENVEYAGIVHCTSSKAIELQIQKDGGPVTILHHVKSATGS
ncbi:hypothetical protein E4U22_003997 [Claviceps purpurea]|nr:hypothetical protein E4U35_004923 [Claviceps purpurea]KAG6204462.1 hypothetical protein E4U50_005232 [Claviceps purpurea]KAG6237839.1 hypothetical protein E4U25_002328 [Claviceps purpurea]KAG6319885.1 hypothetical protein E4U22_003997 [Claviceps purpurea]